VVLRRGAAPEAEGGPPNGVAGGEARGLRKSSEPLQAGRRFQLRRTIRL